MANTSLPNGFAIRRNGTCLVDVEVNCGQTAAPYTGCCPSGTVCPNQYNIACCQPGQNCTNALVATPHCANSSWVMYDNGGFFCCEVGSSGYATIGSDGCLLPIAAPPNDIQFLASVSQTVSSSSSTSSSTVFTSSSSTTVASFSSTTSPASSNIGLPSAGKSEGNSLEAGAIAGIVIGIVLGIAVLLLVGSLLYRRRKRKSPITSSGHLGSDGKSREVYVHELGGINRQELPVSISMIIPGQKHREYQELPAGDVDRFIQH